MITLELIKKSTTYHFVIKAEDPVLQCQKSHSFEGLKPLIVS